MPSLRVKRRRAKDLIIISLNAYHHAANEDVKIYCITTRGRLSPCFDVCLDVGNNFDLFSAEGIEFIISIATAIGMNRVAVFTQRHVIQKPPRGNITGQWWYKKMRTWDQNEIPHDHDMTWPAELHTYHQAEHENRVRASEIAPEGSIVFQIRRINPVNPEFDADPLPRTETLQNTDPPAENYRAWMAEGTEGVEHVRLVITRDDDVVALQNRNGRPIRLSVVVLPSLDGRPSTSQASTMGDLRQRTQSSRQAESYGVVPRSSASIYDNPQAGPSNGGRPTRFTAEGPSFSQTTPSRAQAFGIPPQSSHVRPQPRQQADNPQAGPSNGGRPTRCTAEGPSFSQTTLSRAQAFGIPTQSSHVRPQPRQQAETWRDAPRLSGSTYNIPQAGPSNWQRAQQSMPEIYSFPQTALPHVYMPGMTPHESRSFAPNTRRSQRPDLKQFGMARITLDEVHREELTRPSMRRPRNSLATGPMGSQIGRNRDGDRSRSRPRQSVAPGNEASQTPSTSRPAMPQLHGPNDLRRVPQHTTLPETIELSSSSDDDESEERSKRPRFH
ncbi:hypothetical protein NU219Hw_g5579t1 [Hortaea werneckii]